MLDFLIRGLEYGLMAAAAVGMFAVCVALLTPVVLLAFNAVGCVLSIGGNKDV